MIERSSHTCCRKRLGRNLGYKSDSLLTEQVYKYMSWRQIIIFKRAKSAVTDGPLQWTHIFCPPIASGVTGFDRGIGGLCAHYR